MGERAAGSGQRAAIYKRQIKDGSKTKTSRNRATLRKQTLNFELF